MGVQHYALIIANGACGLCVQFDTIEEFVKVSVHGETKR
jgi:hypothetical protein